MPKKILKKCSIHQDHTVENIHKAIRENLTIALAAKALHLADVTSLSSHLGKFILDGHVLSFEQFKALSVTRAESIWGHNYHQIMQAPVIICSNYSGAHIHYIVQHSRTIREAASQLGTRDHSLNRLLKRFICNDEVLSFDLLKRLSVKQAKKVFASFYEPQFPEQRVNLTPEQPMFYSFSVLEAKIKELSPEQLDSFDFFSEFNKIPQISSYHDFGFFSSANNMYSNVPASKRRKG